jgi:2'-5' RNA ligase
MTRTFISLEMNEHLQSYLEGVIRQVARVLPGVRWVDARGIHLTLAFLGELTDERLTAAMEVADEAARQARPFSYTLSHLGSFGPLPSPRVIWMGIDEPTHALTNLHRVLNQTLAQRGFTLDKRPFSPHLTLARLKAPLLPPEQQQLQRILAGKLPGLTSSEAYTVRHLEVIKSELSREGAHYSVLRKCEFSNK